MWLAFTAYVFVGKLDIYALTASFTTRVELDIHDYPIKLLNNSSRLSELTSKDI